MRTRPQTIIIASMALVIAVLAWALVYFGRDEMHLSAKAPEDEIPVRSALSMQGGSAAVRLTKESQEASGIAVQTLEKARAEAAAEVYGVIVNVQPLLDLRARYARQRVGGAIAARCGLEQRSRLPALQETVRRRSQCLRARAAGGGSAVESRPGPARRCRAGGRGRPRHDSRGLGRGACWLGHQSRIFRVPGLGAAA